ncbi:MAG: exodeoxyribonuclease VII large subunit [Chloroherpetonaceae bacterium]|nr:exodeoxyribonuclease VII large subunit [Chloroherpetonaceae bacterium]
MASISKKNSPESLSVTELTMSMKELLEANYSSVRVRGEISNFKLASSGHLYFTLKDEGAQIPAVMWRSGFAALPKEIKESLEDGLEVVAAGKIEIYAPHGKYQMICSGLRPVGEGFLQREFQKLFERLEKEGLFDVTRKKTLPQLPSRIGIVTSPTGAVIEDICNVFSRRYPGCDLVLAPVRVQGEEAADEIARAIRYFNGLKENRPDALIVGRGGGSLEDLWAFNEERVARAIFESNLPIVSAVGHQTDYTIADYVADVRAGTPSMAAEMLSPSSSELVSGMIQLLAKSHQHLRAEWRHRASEVIGVVSSYGFNRPQTDLNKWLQTLDYTIDSNDRALQNKFNESKALLKATLSELEALSPEKVLRRGYALIRKKNTILRKCDDATLKDLLEIELSDGTLLSEVQEVKKKP